MDAHGTVIIKAKLHDVVRDMASWKERGKFAVITTGVLNVPKMDKVERLSMISVGELRELNQIALVCPNLSTFLSGNGVVHELSDKFFQYMPNL